MSTNDDREPVRLSRRRALELFGGAGAATALAPWLAACGRDEPQGSAESPSPDSGAEPSGTVSIAIPLATDADQDFYTQTFADFEAKTGVKVDFLHYPDPQFAEAIQGLFQGGDEPDTYRMVKPPAEMHPAWTKDWIQPLDDYMAITDLLAEEYGDSALDPATSGLHIGGQLYGVPGVRNEIWAELRPLMVNMEVLSQYGVSAPPQTWSELRDAAAKVSTDSGGDIYGFAIFGAGAGGGAASVAGTMVPVYSTAGPVREIAAQVPVDYQTGQAGAAHPSVVDSVVMLRQLVEDGSVISGWQNLDAQQFWQAWAGGQIAMAPIAPWWSEEIRKINADSSMMFAPFPVPDSGRKGYQSRAFTWAPTWGMTRASQNPDATASLIAYLGTLDVQRQYYEASRIPTALASEYSDTLSDIAAEILGLDPDIRRSGPSPTARSQDAWEVIQAIQQQVSSPTWNEIAFSAIDGGADYEEAAADFDEKLGQVITDAIAAAIDSGADVGENLFTFADWDPLSDYVTEPQS